MDDLRIVFAVANYGPLWAPAVSSWLSCVGFAARHFQIEQLGRIAGAGITDRMYTHSAENALVQEFLDSDATHLFFSESDMILPTDCIVKLAALRKPIVSGIYFLRGGTGQPCLYVKGVTPVENPYTHSPVHVYPEGEPFQLDPQGGGCCGFGCVLFARSVFETVEFPWFDLKEKGYGSDMYFYTKVRDKGIPVWVDPSVECEQIEYTVTSKADYTKRLNTDPEFAKTGFVIGGARA